MKKFILGFIVAAILFSLLFSLVPAGAAIQEYVLYKSEAKLMVDGKEYNNPALPILNYKGYNYIPAATFRDICKAIGVDFQWIGEVKQIQIKTNSAAARTGGDSNKETVEGGEKVREIPTLTYEGKTYVELGVINAYHRLSFDKPIFVEKNNDDGSRNVDLVDKNDASKVLISDIPYIIIPKVRSIGTTFAACVEYEYYLNIMLPLIQ